jgi:hypothetical protein
MRYDLEMDIDAPRARVIELFLDAENLKKWQPSLVSFEPLTDGNPNALGGKSKQLHKMGSREVEMVATITAHDPPGFFAATYESDDVWNLIENRFSEIDATRTHWVLNSEFRSTNVMMKIMMWLAPGMFRKQTHQFMVYFKAFVEGAGEGIDDQKKSKQNRNKTDINLE